MEGNRLRSHKRTFFTHITLKVELRLRTKHNPTNDAIFEQLPAWEVQSRLEIDRFLAAGTSMLKSIVARFRLLG